MLLFFFQNCFSFCRSFRVIFKIFMRVWGLCISVIEPWCLCGGQKVTCRSQFSPLTLGSWWWKLVVWTGYPIVLLLLLQSYVFLPATFCWLAQHATVFLPCPIWPLAYPCSFSDLWGNTGHSSFSGICPILACSHHSKSLFPLLLLLFCGLQMSFFSFLFFQWRKAFLKDTHSRHTGKRHSVKQSGGAGRLQPTLSLRAGAVRVFEGSSSSNLGLDILKKDRMTDWPITVAWHVLISLELVESAISRGPADGRPELTGLLSCQVFVSSEEDEEEVGHFGSYLVMASLPIHLPIRVSVPLPVAHSLSEVTRLLPKAWVTWLLWLLRAGEGVMREGQQSVS